VIERQREAIRQAAPAALESAAREQDKLVRAMAAVDAQRSQLIRVIQAGVQDGIQATAECNVREPPTLSRLLERAASDDDQRVRLLGVASELREAIAAARRGSSIVRDAATALARHMAGIQQTVHSALSRARVYERRGRLNLGSSMPAALDMKS
jgi:hypothetical protein